MSTGRELRDIVNNLRPGTSFVYVQTQNVTNQTVDQQVVSGQTINNSNGNNRGGGDNNGNNGGGGGGGRGGNGGGNHGNNSGGGRGGNNNNNNNHNNNNNNNNNYALDLSAAVMDQWASFHTSKKQKLSDGSAKKTKTNERNESLNDDDYERFNAIMCGVYDNSPGSIVELSQWMRSAANYQMINKNNIIMTEAVCQFMTAIIENETENDEEKNEVLREIDTNNNSPQLNRNVIQSILIFIYCLVTYANTIETMHIFDLLNKLFTLSITLKADIDCYTHLKTVAQSFIIAQCRYRNVSIKAVVVLLNKYKPSRKNQMLWMYFIACCCGSIVEDKNVNNNYKPMWESEWIYALLQLICNCADMEEYRWLFTPSHKMMNEILQFLFLFCPNESKQIIDTQLKSKSVAIISMIRKGNKKHDANKKKSKKNRKKRKKKLCYYLQENTVKEQEDLLKHFRSHPEIVEKERKIVSQIKKNEKQMMNMDSIEDDIVEIEVNGKTKHYCKTMGKHYHLWNRKQLVIQWWGYLCKKQDPDKSTKWTSDWSWDTKKRYIMCLKGDCKAFFVRPKKKGKSTPIMQWHNHNTKEHK